VELPAVVDGAGVSAGARPNTGQHRALDLVVAVAGIILTFPLMLAIAAAIKVTSPGPVFYRQYRVGLDRRRRERPCRREGRAHDVGGQLFRILKFRTMRVDAGSAQVWARPDDERVTPLGRLLRRYRLDELPQLVNVLRGEMSVVGPRPEQPELFARLRSEIDRYDRRQEVLPGITGWAQIHLAYDRCVDDVRRKLAYDLEYIDRRTPLEDVHIMLRTFPVMLGLSTSRAPEMTSTSQPTYPTTHPRTRPCELSSSSEHC
jgi:lipopolysaccharide/colanic/teichoic acid biosynthesis glycosyltransferase